MSRQAESALSKRIIDALNARGHFVYKNHGSVYMPKGLADITGSSRLGRAIFLETKMPGEEDSGLSPEQKTMARAIVRRCPTCVYCVVSSVADAIRAVEAIQHYPIILATGRAAMVELSDLPEDQRQRVLTLAA